VTIRPLSEADIDGAAARELDVIGWDAQFGGVTVRPSTPARIRESLAEFLAAGRTASWVALLDGEVVGLASVDWPPEASWVSGMVASDPSRTAYLGSMSIQPGRRGSGIGAALAAYVLAEFDAADIDISLLHHAALNPLSTPFWHRMGYRPLWTAWEVRPHRALR
jgi:GNAT superfamily N-acetyltransferase